MKTIDGTPQNSPKPRGGLHGNGDGAVLEPLPDFGHPAMQSLGSLLQHYMFGPVAALGGPEPQVVLLVRPVQSDRRFELNVVIRIHGLILRYIKHAGPVG